MVNMNISVLKSRWVVAQWCSAKGWSTTTDYILHPYKPVKLTHKPDYAYLYNSNSIMEKCAKKTVQKLF